jgi:hypothetical protein
MRRLFTLVLTVMAALLVLTAPPATAGGPTSVLIVNYDGSRAAGALTGSTAYDDLSRALDVMNTDVMNTPVGESAPPGDFMESRIRLTWMIHDVTPWRIDAVTIDGDDVWVNTMLTAGEVPTGSGTWHRAKDAQLLLDTLGALGVLGTTSSPAPGSPATSGGAADSPTATGTVAARVDPPRTTTAEWTFAMAGALVALCGGVLLGRRTAPSRARERVPGDTRPADSVELTPSGRTGAG